MGSMASSHVWAMRAAFVALSIATLLYHLLPLDTVPRRWAPPDLMLAFTLAWSLRRPDYTPPLAVAAVWLLSDLLLQRPPGVMAALVLLGCHYLQTRAAALSKASFAGEWLAVCLTIFGIAALNRAFLWLFAVHQAQVGLIAIQVLLTMAAYPLVALITHFVLRVRQPAPGDSDTIGGRA